MRRQTRRETAVLLPLFIFTIWGCGDEECAVPEGVYSVMVETVSDPCGLGLADTTAEFDGGGTTSPPPMGCSRTSTYRPNACGFAVVDECVDADGPYSFEVVLDINDSASGMQGTFTYESRFPDGTIDCASVFDLTYTRL